MDRLCGKIKKRSREIQGLGSEQKKKMALPFPERGNIGNEEHILWRRSKASFRYVNFEMRIIRGRGDGI